MQSEPSTVCLSSTNLSEPFEAYRSLEKEIESRYQHIRSAYPLAFFVLENEIRMHLAVERSLARRSVDRNLSGFSAGAQLRKAVKLKALRLNRKSHAPERRAFMISIGRTAEVGQQLARHLTEAGMRQFWGEMVLRRYPLRIEEVATCGLVFSQLKSLAHCGGVEMLLESSETLSRLERQVKRNVEVLKSLILKARVSLYVSDSCHHIRGRIVYLAMKELGVTVIEVAHGYTQQPHLISVAPVVADCEIVWSHDLASRMKAVVGEKEASKIQSFGFPRQRFAVPPLRDRKQALVLVDQMSLMTVDESARYLRAMQKVVLALRSLHLAIVFRVHPGERNLGTVDQLKSTFGVEVSTDALEVDLCRARIVVGSRSSVLVEAAFNGIYAVQVRELATAKCEGSSIVDFDCNPAGELARLISEEDGVDKDVVEPFDHAAFHDFVKKLLSVSATC